MTTGYSPEFLERMDLLALSVVDKRIDDCTPTEIRTLMDRQQLALQRLNATIAHGNAVIAEAEACGCQPVIPTDADAKTILSQAFVDHRIDCPTARISETERGATL